MNEIVSVINSVGFPIVACFVMYQQVNKLNGIILELTTTLKSIDTRIEQLEKEKGV